MSVTDETIRKNLLSSAINLNNETIGKLMFLIHRNYKAFVNHTLLSDTTKDNLSIAWLIDNNRKEDDGQLLEMSQKVSTKIESLIIK
ncbi:hypothetical protein [Vagococcus fluvialis]|uniref:hypothetical protein n=1 Tax=Vagococcus fluvialis TaxID=2738 RepID=UPI001D0A8FDE|nr:hypothetical protein [Vagococcus fluvialis]UDM80395.1 hypothetical protein K5K97_03455 [Vagococcus fluvialis]